MSLNDQQRDIAETLVGGINVAAGAGTGKTFTLTQRIVEFAKSSLRNNPDDDNPLDHVLAITFTKKAASELKSRVRLAFLEEAANNSEFRKQFLNCALTVDNAWISTIHSMAGKILRENAIDFKIDPEFQVLDSKAEEVIFAQAMELASIEVENGDDEGLQRLIDSRKILSEQSGQFGGPPTLSEIVESVLAEISHSVSGYEGLKTAKRFSDPYNAANSLLPMAKNIRPMFDEYDFINKKNKDKVPLYIESLDKNIPLLEEWLEGNSICDLSESGELDVDDVFDKSMELIKIIGRFPATTDTFGNSKIKNSENPDAFFEYRKALKNSLDAIVSNVMVVVDDSLLKFAKIVEKHLIELKSGATTKMTESDMLTRCDELLGMKEHERIVNAYKDRFDLIMLDEFQDTDKLQMSLISKLAKWGVSQNGTLTMSNLCTVGDMQQSIYRFRGGDVELSQARKQSFDSGEGLQLELSCNYRSHKDVLDVVEWIFSQDEVFGDDFLKLDAGCETLDESCDKIFENKPRVTFDYIHGGTIKNGPSCNAEEVTFTSARRIAEHFRYLADEGVAPGDMALLLGRLKNADVYAKALGDVGLESAITGGSLFSSMNESKLVSYLLRYATNESDEVALLNVLVSDLFEVTDDDLIGLCCEDDNGEASHKSISKSFSNVKAGDVRSSDQLLFASKLLSDFIDCSRRDSAAKALTKLFSDSGILAELEESGDAQSLVSAGTLKKAVDIVRDIEANTCGVAETSNKYDEYVESAKESPGILVTTNSDFIPIMTIHSSKGLEYKHVAVSEFKDGDSGKSQYYFAENIDDITCFAFKPTTEDMPSKESYETFKKVTGFKSLLADDPVLPLYDFDEGVSSKYEMVQSVKDRIKGIDEQTRLFSALNSYDKYQGLEEARRVLYVAMTRARESLYVSVQRNAKPESGYRGTYLDVFNALSTYFGKPVEEFDDNFDFVQLPIRLRRIWLASEELQPSADDTECEANDSADSGKRRERTIPIYEDRVETVFDKSGTTNNFEGLYSYSKLSKSMVDSQVDEEDAAWDEPSESIEEAFVDDEYMMMSKALIENLEGQKEDPTALGTAFHRIAQAAIIEATKRGEKQLSVSESCSVETQSKTLGLSEGQIDRLEEAVKLWFGSDAARELASHDQLLAEVPFGVKVAKGAGLVECGESTISEDEFYLFGEIDALGVNDDETAFLIDYKTGNKGDVSQEKLHEKYAFQAKCYAYALMVSGFKRVEAKFVIMEQPVHVPGAKTIEPMYVSYSFGMDDLNVIKREIIEAHDRYVEGVRSGASEGKHE